MKKKTITILIALTLCVVLLFSLTSCMKIGMQLNNVVSKLNSNGMSVEYLRTTPMTDGHGIQGYVFDEIILTKGVVTDVGVSSIVDESTGTASDKLYIIYTGDELSADWAEEQCTNYIKDNSEDLSKWIVYRFERVIMCGHYQLIALIRGY